MPSLATLASQEVVKAFLVGRPGTGKTGSMAALANAGYKLRIINLDPQQNITTLLRYVEPKNFANVHVVSLEDNYKLGGKRPEVAGPPKAFKQAFDLLVRWKGTEPDGTEFDLGAVRDWGKDTVLVVDSLTGLNNACMMWALFQGGRMEIGPRQRDWGTASDCEAMFLQKAAGSHVNCNVLVTTHIKLVGPPDPDQDDDDDVRKAKRELRDKIPYRNYPAAIGRQLPQWIAGGFPYALLYEPVAKGLKVERRIILAPRDDIDLKAPVVGLESPLAIEDGLLKLFQAVHGEGVAKRVPGGAHVLDITTGEKVG